MATSVSDIVEITTPQEPVQLGLSAMTQSAATSAGSSKRKVTKPPALSSQTTSSSQVSLAKIPRATGPFSRGFSGGFGNGSSGTSPFSGGFSNGFGRG